MARGDEKRLTPQGEDFSAWYNELVLRAELADRGADATVLACDITDEADVDRAVAGIAAGGSVDVLVNSAAVDADGTVYLADDGNARIQVFDAEGQFLYAWGDAAPGDPLGSVASVELDGLGEKSVDRLKRSVETSKSRPLGRLIFALGIRHVGERTGELLAERFGSLEALAFAGAERIDQGDGITEPRGV